MCGISKQLPVVLDTCLEGKRSHHGKVHAVSPRKCAHQLVHDELKGTVGLIPGILASLMRGAPAQVQACAPPYSRNAWTRFGPCCSARWL